jgi:lysophospholipase L1-like esterase
LAMFGSSGPAGGGLRRLAAVVLSSLLTLVAAEVGLRVLWPGDNRYQLWMPNLSRTMRLAPGVIHGVGLESHIQVNSQGIRGPEWSPQRQQEYRFLAIGGSTTESLYVDQPKTWPALLQTLFDKTVDGRVVWVGNLGRAGFNTRDHLGLMRYAIGQWDVDALVMLIGGNDMIHRLMQDESYDPHFTDKDREYRSWLNRRFALVPLAAQIDEERWPFKRTALWMLARQLRARFTRTSEDAPNRIVRDQEGLWLHKVRKRRADANQVGTLPPLGSGLDEYERHVREIASLAHARSLRLVVVTQPFLWRAAMPESEQALLWWGWRPDGRFYTTAALASAMDAYNQRLLDVCVSAKIECIDLAGRIPRSPLYFFDDLHFTEAGSARVAAELVDELRRRPPFAVPSSP